MKKYSILFSIILVLGISIETNGMNTVIRNMRWTNRIGIATGMALCSYSYTKGKKHRENIYSRSANLLLEAEENGNSAALQREANRHEQLAKQLVPHKKTIFIPHDEFYTVQSSRYDNAVTYRPNPENLEQRIAFDYFVKHELGHVTHDSTKALPYLFPTAWTVTNTFFLGLQYARLALYKKYFSANSRLPRILTMRLPISIIGSYFARSWAANAIFIAFKKYDEYRADSFAIQHTNSSADAESMHNTFLQIQDFEYRQNGINPDDTKNFPSVARELLNITHPSSYSRAMRLKKRAEELREQGK